MIRRNLSEYVQKVASFYPTVTLVGPRQSGKTALADNIEKPLVVYAGATHEGIAVNYADTRLWCR